jgi:LysR family transcriptional regulator, glycine cleavage system transcriptional activator
MASKYPFTRLVLCIALFSWVGGRLSHGPDDPAIPAIGKPWNLSFREELHAIDAVAAGQGIAICSDVLVSNELRTGALVKAHDLSLPGYGFYVAYLPDHPQQSSIEAFSAWMRAVA